MTQSHSDRFAMLLREPGSEEQDRLEQITTALPEPGRGEVRVAVGACAVCRTDLQIVSGDLPAHRLPIVPGHQVVGVIEAVGPEVESSRIGQAVGVSWFAGSCGHCAWCLEGRQNLCEQAEFTGW